MAGGYLNLVYKNETELKFTDSIHYLMQNLGRTIHFPMHLIPKWWCNQPAVYIICKQTFSQFIRDG